MIKEAMERLSESGPSKDENRVLSFQKAGYPIHVGRNSFSNERIVSEHRSRDCYWLHAMAARGSHVILCRCDRLQPEESVVLFAAALAIRYSHSESRSVTVSLLRDVFKPEDAGPGVWKSAKSFVVEVPE